ncbi:tetratricopeptide repeat-containing sensor histidine kinase [Pedobacter sp. PWIIR3]
MINIKSISTIMWGLIFLLIILSYFPGKAQNKSELDKLQLELAAAQKPSSKLDLLDKIATIYSKSDSANTFSYTNQAIALADQTKDIKAIGHAYYTQGQYFYFKALGSKAIPYFQKSLQIQTSIKNQEGMADALSGLGKSLIVNTKYQEALPYITEAKDIYLKLNLNGGLISCYNQLGIINNFLGKKDIAIDNFIKSSKVIATIKDQTGYIPIQINLGRLFWEIGQLKEAKKHLLEAITRAQDTKDNLNLGKATLNLGNIYIEEKNYAEATKLINEASNIFEKIAFKAGIVSCNNNLGAISIRQGNYKESIPYLKKALEYIDQKNDKPATVLTQQNIAYAYTMMNDFDEADKWFKMAENETGSGMVTPYVLGELYNHKSILDSLRGNFSEALKTKSKYYKISNQQLNEKISKQINELQTKYDTEKKEAQISLLSKENSINLLELKNQKLEIADKQSQITQQNQSLTINTLRLKNQSQRIANQQLENKQKAENIKNLQKQSKIQRLELNNRALQLKQRNLLMAGFLIIALAIGLAAYFYYKRYRANQEALLKEEINRQQEIATKSLFEGEQKERIRLARDLHDSIGQMLSVVKMNMSTLHHQFPDNKTTTGTLDLVDKTIGEVRNISHNLLPEALNFGLFSALEDMTDKINESGGTTVELNVPEEAREHKFTKQNELSIYRIVQEVLGNMIKHAEATKITLDVVISSTGLSIAIKDNGKGFDPNKIKDSKGLGWKNISARVNLLDGEMRVQSEKLSGTQIDITIPG